jgi:hypothetical protein
MFKFRYLWQTIYLLHISSSHCLFPHPTISNKYKLLDFRFSVQHFMGFGTVWAGKPLPTFLRIVLFLVRHNLIPLRCRQ